MKPKVLSLKLSCGIEMFYDIASDQFQIFRAYSNEKVTIPFENLNELGYQLIEAEKVINRIKEEGKNVQEIQQPKN